MTRSAIGNRSLKDKDRGYEWMDYMEMPVASMEEVVVVMTVQT